MSIDAVHVVLTGGTIDSRWNAARATSTVLDSSAVPAYLASLDTPFTFHFSSVCMKDSKELTDDDLEAMIQTVADSPIDNVVVLHGTDTMTDSARLMKGRDLFGKRIVFTGAMTPLTGFAPSDAGFNLGFALASLAQLAPGTYLAMNGTIFDPDEVEKDRSAGRFRQTVVDI